MLTIRYISISGITEGSALSICVNEALNLLVTEELYRALFYMPLYTFLHNFLNVLVQIANKMGFQMGKEMFLSWKEEVREWFQLQQATFKSCGDKERTDR
jgi:hypothetical protein